MDMVPMKDCARQSDHRFETDAHGVDRCAFCSRTWVETVRGVGIGGDLPARTVAMSEKMNREAGLY